MDREKLNNFIDKLKKTWEVYIVIISLIATLILNILPYLFPKITIETEWIFATGYMGIIAIIFILLDIRKELQENIVQQSFQNLKTAEPEILKKIIKASKRNKDKTIEIKIWGNRLSRVSTIILEVFRMAKEGKISNSKLDIVVYHTDPSLLNTEKYLPKIQGSPFTEKHKAYLESLDSNIKGIKHDANELGNVSVKFIKCTQVPFCYAYLIEDSWLYWGYFNWHHMSGDWIGPSNKCYYIEKGDDPEFMIDWFQNRFEIFDGVFGETKKELNESH
ncbi:hypothetical protein [Psychroserpens algicola]|uniref:hypothetical protein n=1 Tax=Psychroserpens algicola TaxID=1719034 RepID=UPI0019546710|nr:hypothetical protein [Psychroserpens algicola]